MKTIISKALTFETPLGSAVFRHVPVMVEDDVKAKDFDAAKGEYSLAGDVILALSREVAKIWLKGYDSSKSPSAAEIYEIMAIFGVNASQLGKLIHMSRANVSKVLSEKIPLNDTAKRLMLILLQMELKDIGIVKGFLEANFKIYASDLKPELDYRNQQLTGHLTA